MDRWIGKLMDGEGKMAKETDIWKKTDMDTHTVLMEERLEKKEKKIREQVSICFPRPSDVTPLTLSSP